MKRLLLAILVLVLAIVPAANGVCGLGCDLERRNTERSVASGDQECPLHHQSDPSRAPAPHAPASDRCGHDHTAGGVGLLRVSPAAPAPVIVGIIADAVAIPTPLSSARITRASGHLTPPNRPSQLLALRI